MIQIQQRDLRILKLCYEQKCLSSDQVLEGVFHGVHRSEGYRRIQELEKAGFVKRIRPLGFGKQTVIQLTGRGEGLARGESQYDVPRLRRLNLNTLAHDLLVNQVRLRIEQLWDGHWIPEVELKRTRSFAFDPKQIPDGVMIFPSKRSIAIEVENSLKTFDRYRHIFREYDRDREFYGVLYVASSAPILYGLQRHLKAAVERHDLRDLIFLMLLEDLLKSPPAAAWSVRGSAPVFKVRSF